MHIQGLDAGSLVVLHQTHRMLQPLWIDVAKQRNIILLEATRGRAAQEDAFKHKRSLAHFGESPHNYIPSIANDVVPDGDDDLRARKIDWVHVPQFLDLHEIIMAVAKAHNIPLTWGGDWDGDGDRFDQKLIDLPHYELRPWRQWAKESRLAA